MRLCLFRTVIVLIFSKAYFIFTGAANMKMLYQESNKQWNPNTEPSKYNKTMFRMTINRMQCYFKC